LDHDFYVAPAQLPKMKSKDKYAVLGNPIEHSKSPQIHQAFALETQQAISYEKILVPLGEFENVLEELIHRGYSGMNVTVPFKLDAFNAANDCSIRARAAGAVNTITIKADGSSYGDNTDGLGLVNDLCNNHNAELAGKSLLLLGAGGAVRGVLQPLLETKPKEIIVVNRTESKAQELVKYFKTHFPELIGDIELSAVSYSACPTQPFDWIINGTSASLVDDLPPIPVTCVSATSCCYDMLYGSNTVFLQWAQQLGAAKCIDGLGMLVEQAAVSFRLWRGLKPHTQAVIEALR